MLSSVEEKAEKKKSLIFYTIGALLVFGVTFFAQYMYDLMKEIL